MMSKTPPGPKIPPRYPSRYPPKIPRKISILTLPRSKEIQKTRGTLNVLMHKRFNLPEYY